MSEKVKEIKYTDEIDARKREQISKFSLISNNEDKPEQLLEKESVHLIVALSNQEKIVGYVLLEKEIDDLSPNIKYIEIKKEFRGRNIGTNLMNKIITYVDKRANQKEITLIAINDSADFFRKFNFKKTAEDVPLMKLTL